MRSQELILAIGWLRTYRREWLRADVVGGITAGLVVVPQAMPYATIADLPVQVGLYTCMVPMAVYALLGGSRILSVSTTSTIATLSASTLLAAGVAADSTGADDALGDLATLVLLTGLVLLLARLFRLGPLVDNMWIASLPRRALAQARTAPGWAALERTGRLHPTARAALDAFMARA